MVPEGDLCTSSVCWYEFLRGPVTDESVEIVRGMLRARVLPFTADQAVESTRLFKRRVAFAVSV